MASALKYGFPLIVLMLLIVLAIRIPWLIIYDNNFASSSSNSVNAVGSPASQVIDRLCEACPVEAKKEERCVTKLLPKSATCSQLKDKQLIVLLWTQIRSGSTLTAQLLSLLLPRTYYSIEPIRTMLSMGFPNSQTSKTKLNYIIESFMKCNIGENENHLRNRKSFRVGLDTLNEFCLPRALSESSIDYLCHDGAFRSFMCNWADMHLMKIVTTRLHTILDFLDNQSYNIKIIHLLRDPRAIMNSMSKLPDFEKILYEPNYYCQNMREDLQTAAVIEEKHPNRYFRLQYEDLAMSPTAAMQRVLHFLDVPFTASFQHTINRLTQVMNKQTNDNSYHTEKYSKDRPFKWRNIMNFHQVHQIQDNCSDVLQQMGMRLFVSEEEYKDSSIPVWSTLVEGNNLAH